MSIFEHRAVKPSYFTFSTVTCSAIILSDCHNILISCSVRWIYISAERPLEVVCEKSVHMDSGRGDNLPSMTLCDDEMRCTWRFVANSEPFTDCSGSWPPVDAKTFIAYQMRGF